MDRPARVVLQATWGYQLSSIYYAQSNPALFAPGFDDGRPDVLYCTVRYGVGTLWLHDRTHQGEDLPLFSEAYEKGNIESKQRLTFNILIGY
jgi:GrpB-like predicted nucleotidyltransferase (UPF0157 family)